MLKIENSDYSEENLKIIRENEVIKILNLGIDEEKEWVVQ